MRTVSELNQKLVKIRQRFPSPGDVKIEVELGKELARLEHLELSNKRIGVAVGSRGINNIVKVTRGVVDYLKSRGARPFVFPAMGSHGGATAEGQVRVLAGYGITSENVGAPLHATMEVETLGKVGHVGVFMNNLAWASDGVILINRIKPHTDFHGDYESGLVKMSVIGLGCHKQALEIHSFGVEGLRNKIPQVAHTILESGKVLAGVGLVEDAYDRTIHVQVVLAREILNVEPQLLELARQNMPSLPVQEMDVLIVDRMGKNISGVGLDPNVIGRYGIPGMQDPQFPDIKSILVDDLTGESHGNALGMGLADVITKKLFAKINFKSTLENAYTSSFLQRAKTPVVAQNAAAALDFALRNCGDLDAKTALLVRIKDTLHLDECFVSGSLLNELDPSVEPGDEKSLFDQNGDLLPFED